MSVFAVTSEVECIGPGLDLTLPLEGDMSSKVFRACELVWSNT